MNKLKLGLYNCPQSTKYKLIKLTADFDANDPCLLWVFDTSKVKLAKKIMRNMNIAKLENAAGLMFN